MRNKVVVSTILFSGPPLSSGVADGELEQAAVCGPQVLLDERPFASARRPTDAERAETFHRSYVHDVALRQRGAAVCIGGLSTVHRPVIDNRYRPSQSIGLPACERRRFAERNRGRGRSSSEAAAMVTTALTALTDRVLIVGSHALDEIRAFGDSQIAMRR